MSRGAGVAPTRALSRSWLHILLGAVRPEFRPEVYVPEPGDRVLARRVRPDAPALSPQLPRFDSGGLPRVLQLELEFALQRRHDERGAELTPRVFGELARWAERERIESLLDHGDRWWGDSAQALRPQVRAQTLAFLRYARLRLQVLREEQTDVEPWEWDVWRVDRLDPDGRWSHQPTRRIYFCDIEPPWLKALAKRWGRWRLSAATKSPLSVCHTTASLRKFCRWLERAEAVPKRPSDLTRELLERFLAEVRTDPEVGLARKRSLVVDLKVFLDDVRMHRWEPELPISAVYHRGELPRQPQPLPRFIDEFVMGQIESERNLARLPDQTTRTLILLLIETGLRSVDALRLPFEPVTTDQAGAPYLMFRNHKLSREAVVPMSDRVLGEIRAQQAELGERFAQPPPVLFPRPCRNVDGRYPLELTTLNRRIRSWLEACDVRDAQGGSVRITSHQFRHTLGTRLVNHEVPLDTIRRLLDHDSPAMTARYAQVKDQTLRREWERYQERINIRGELIPLDRHGQLSDAAWAKENLARAKQTLPNGYCGLPLQQRCPHPNACLTCDHFLTTAEFLPGHRDQLERTRELIAKAEAAGNERLVEMNRPVELNLARIIEGIEALPEAADG
ncbi:MAG: site-specific integrase [Actinobacteria bacterium]|nr:site-specific integrase [Actinomycetota bacterium]